MELFLTTWESDGVTCVHIYTCINTVMFLPDVCSQNYQPGRLQHLPFPTSVGGGILTSEGVCKSCSLSSFLLSEYSTLFASLVASSSQQHRSQNVKKQNLHHQQIQLRAIAASCHSLFLVTNRQHLCTERYQRAPPLAVLTQPSAQAGSVPHRTATDWSWWSPRDSAGHINNRFTLDPP